MGIASQLRRAAAIAAATLAFGGVLDLAYIVVLCPNGRLAARVARHEPVIVDSGYRFAVAGEMIVTCTRPHLIGPVPVHDDFGCYCVPAGTELATLDARFGAACTIEKLLPARTDSGGICRHAHCEDLK